MKKPKKPVRKANCRAKRYSYDPVDPTAIPSSTGMEVQLAEIQLPFPGTPEWYAMNARHNGILEALARGIRAGWAAGQAELVGGSYEDWLKHKTGEHLLSRKS